MLGRRRGPRAKLLVVVVDSPPPYALPHRLPSQACRGEVYGVESDEDVLVLSGGYMLEGASPSMLDCVVTEEGERIYILYCSERPVRDPKTKVVKVKPLNRGVLYVWRSLGGSAARSIHGAMEELARKVEELERELVEAEARYARRVDEVAREIKEAVARASREEASEAAREAVGERLEELMARRRLAYREQVRAARALAEGREALIREVARATGRNVEELRGLSDRELLDMLMEVGRRGLEQRGGG